MTWQVSLSNQARKFLRDLRDARLRERLEREIDALIINPRPPGTGEESCMTPFFCERSTMNPFPHGFNHRLNGEEYYRRASASAYFGLVLAVSGANYRAADPGTPGNCQPHFKALTSGLPMHMGGS
jgi:hypothetical protein